VQNKVIAYQVICFSKFVLYCIFYISISFYISSCTKM